jgi:hypothetical protein
MRKESEFAKGMSFLNLLAEFDASNVVHELNTHQQYPNYVGSIIGESLILMSFFSLFNFRAGVRLTKFSIIYLNTLFII